MKIAVPAMPTGYVIAEPGDISDQYLGDLMYEGLTRPERESNEPEPALATKWTPNKNATEWTFELRHGVKWQDGAPFTAADVKFTFDAMKNGELRAPGGSYLGTYEKTEIVNPYEVKLYFETPQGNLPTALAYNVFISPKHLLEHEDLANPVGFIKHPIGTGPFQFKSKTQGSAFVVERNPNWWGGEAKLDEVELKVNPEASSTIAQLETGALDISTVPSTQAAALEGGGQVEVSHRETLQFIDISFATNSPPYTEEKVRQALSYAVDSEQILQTVAGGFGEVANGPLPPIVTGKPTGVEPYPYEPKKAEELLEEAGWTSADGKWSKDGKTLSLTLTASNGIPGAPQMAEIAQQEYEDIGIPTDINMVSFTEAYIGMYEGDFNSAAEYFPLSPAGNLEEVFGCGGAQNRFFFCSKEVDAAIQNVNAQVDTDKRFEAFVKLQQLLRDAAPAIWVYFPQEALAVDNRVENLPPVELLIAMTRMWEVSVSE